MSQKPMSSAKLLHQAPQLTEQSPLNQGVYPAVPGQSAGTELSWINT